MNNAEFIKQFDSVQADVYNNAVEHGWWDEPREDGTCLALIHSEVSEILESERAGNPQSKKIPQFTQSEEEAADVVIRLMDWCKHKGYHLSGAILAKHEYNKERAYKHGGKRF